MRGTPPEAAQIPEASRMSRSSPYVRTFTVGAVWFTAVALRMMYRYPGRWSNYPLLHLSVLVVAWVVTALLLGVVVTRFERLRSWWAIGVGTIAGSLLVMWIMALTAESKAKSSAPPSFKSTDAMMAYFAAEVTQWVKKDRGVELDYSLESVKVIEQELERVSKEVDRARPQRGTFGLALGYGAYIGEVIRRRDGGNWAANHPAGGSNSYPLTIRSNVTVFPVGWCWKRLTQGEEDTVYHKALAFAQAGALLTNVAAGVLHSNQVQATMVGSKAAARTQPSRAETNQTR